MGERPEGTRRGTAGWSLPFTWIALLALLVLASFFGWVGILTVVGLAVAGVIGAVLIDTLSPPSQEPRRIDFWLQSERPLTEIAERIRAALDTEPFEYDAENVWEWAEASTRDGLSDFNISRKRRNAEFPVRIWVITRADSTVGALRADLGPRLRKALGTDVKTGSVEYLRGNEYEFTEKDIYSARDDIPALEAPIFDAARFSRERVAALPSDEREARVRQLEAEVDVLLRPATTFRAHQARLLDIIERGLVGELGYALSFLDGAGEQETLWGASGGDATRPGELFLVASPTTGARLRWGLAPLRLTQAQG